jgi:hypothetical protein
MELGKTRNPRFRRDGKARSRKHSKMQNLNVYCPNVYPQQVRCHQSVLLSRSFLMDVAQGLAGSTSRASPCFHARPLRPLPLASGRRGSCGGRRFRCAYTSCSCGGRRSSCAYPSPNNRHAGSLPATLTLWTYCTGAYAAFGWNVVCLAAYSATAQAPPEPNSYRSEAHPEGVAVVSRAMHVCIIMALAAGQFVSLTIRNE